MRSVLILTGNIRTFEQCKNMFMDIIDKYNCDVFICTSNFQYQLHPYQKQANNFYLEKELTNNEIYEKLHDLYANEIIILSEDDINFQYTTYTGDHDDYLKDLKYQFFRKKIVYDIIQSYEIIQNIKYDYIISTRFDMYMDINTLPDKVLGNDIYVSYFSHGHIADQIFVAGSIEDLIKLNDFILKHLKNFSENDIHKILYKGVEHLKLELKSLSSLVHVNRNYV